ncbi:MAG: lytic murein transglycosylase B [Gammaproteobacteria bacterium]|nr:MAG: lytic murein transglycosylase B [Gammaproteobacteria bacterium]
MKKLTLGIALGFIAMINIAAANSELPEIDLFIAEMVAEHDFDSQELTSIFSEVKVKQSILKAISRPAEKSMPWHKYRKIFMQKKRMDDGAEFWRKHQTALTDAETKYGVPAEVIIAILGVETRYGGNVGSYRVIDALSTLAFRYPKRSKFFRSELKHFLLLTREEKLSPLNPIGSYAGAMGLGQFMPSSYREYAVDFDNDGKRDIWTNRVDAIGSIANYLKRHGWVANESIVHQATLEGTIPTELLAKGYKPTLTRSALTAAKVSLASLPEGDDKIALFSLTQMEGESYWLARQNFYSITRYNHSRMYAMAVKQLADGIRASYEK